MLRRLAQKEKLARHRAFAFTLLPIIVAGLLLWYTERSIAAARAELQDAIRKLDDAHQEAERLKKEAANYQIEINKLQEQLKQVLQKSGQSIEQSQQQMNSLDEQFSALKQKASETVNLEKYFHEIDVIDMAKAGPNSDLLVAVAHSRKTVHYRWGGISPEAGLDSTPFVAYILQKTRGIAVNPDGSKLMSMLERTGQPSDGDIVFYSDYTMFYFHDKEGKPYCVGMTPLGIVALDPAFGGEVRGYAKPVLRK